MQQDPDESLSSDSFVEVSLPTIRTNGREFVKDAEGELTTVWQSDDRYYAMLSQDGHECCRECLRIHGDFIARLACAIRSVKLGRSTVDVAEVAVPVTSSPQEWFEAAPRTLHMDFYAEGVLRETWSIHMVPTKATSMTLDELCLLHELYLRSLIAIASTSKTKYDDCRMHSSDGSSYDSCLLSPLTSIHVQVQVSNAAAPKEAESHGAADVEHLGRILRLCDARLDELRTEIGAADSLTASSNSDSRSVSGSALVEECRALVGRLDRVLQKEPVPSKQHGQESFAAELECLYEDDPIGPRTSLAQSFLK